MPGLLACPSEIFFEIAPRCLHRAQPVACLAGTCRGLWQQLRTRANRLRVSSLEITSLETLAMALQKASPEDLELLSVDLSTRGGRYWRADVERGLQELGRFLAGATALRGLSLRLAAFDAAMERLRLGPAGKEAILHCLNCLSRHNRLTSLELSHHNIKLPVADEKGDGDEEAPPVVARPSTRALRRWASDSAEHEVMPTNIIVAVGKFSQLEDLRLAHDEIYGATAEALSRTLAGLPRLTCVDFTRNHINKQAMERVRRILPQRVHILGEAQQTFFFY